MHLHSRGAGQDRQNRLSQYHTKPVPQRDTRWTVPRMPPALSKAPPPAGPNPQPGLIAGICSIVAGVIGFSIPVLGMLVACAGIWLGAMGIRQSRTMKYTPGMTCGIIGISLSALGIVYWVCAILFESYR
jgi:hypothetical protein